MARTLTAPEREHFLSLPHVGVLSIAADDGRPPLAVPSGTATRPAET